LDGRDPGPALAFGYEVPADERVGLPARGRLLVSLEIDDLGDARESAADVGDAIAGLLANPQAPVEVDFSVEELPMEWVESGEVDAEELAELGQFQDPFAAARLYDFSYFPDQQQRALDQVAAVLSDGDRRKVGLLPALVFWRLAVDEVAFAPEDVGRLFGEPSERPAGALDRARVEQSLHNAFKAFEA
jgi:hypothetical protein